MKELTIAMPTYANLDVPLHCLSTAERYTSLFNIGNVIVVDNGYCEGYPADLGDFEVEVVMPERNLGWMDSINSVLLSCDTEYCCMMNDDLGFIPPCRSIWENMIGWLRNPNVGAVVPSSNYVMGPQSIFMDTPNIMYSSFATGILMIIKTDIFKLLGGLDNSKFVGDDKDFVERLSVAGYKTLVDKNLFVWHRGGMTTSRVGASRPLIEGENPLDFSSPNGFKIEIQPLDKEVLQC